MSAECPSESIGPCATNAPIRLHRDLCPPIGSYPQAYEDEDAPERPHQEVEIKIAFIDQFGSEQITSLRTTVSAKQIENTASDIRAALETYYATLGCELLSVQASFEESVPIMTPRATWPKLTLLRGGLLSLVLSSVMGTMAVDGLDDSDESDDPNRIALIRRI